MKAVFLDVNGVLNDGQQNSELNEKNIERLADICKQVDADVVLYSSDKYLFDKDMTPKNEEAEALASALETHGITMHKTPNFVTKKDVKEKKVNLVRPAEIISFLSKNKVQKYSILSNKKVQDKILAQNQFFCEDGLSDMDVQEISKIMK